MIGNRHSALGIICAISLVAAGPALAEPAAIVEDVAGDSVTVGLMELLEPGTEIDLAEGASITLGYLDSCMRERITGGRIVVGKDQSTVTGGEVKRESLECKTNAADGAATGEGAATVFRGGDEKGEPADAAILMGRVPVFLMEGVEKDTLRIERIDRREAIRRIPVTGPVFDAAGALPPLTAGGRYRASIGDRAVEFIIDRKAAIQPGPALERIVKL